MKYPAKHSLDKFFGRGLSVIHSMKRRFLNLQDYKKLKERAEEISRNYKDISLNTMLLRKSPDEARDSD